VLACWVPMAWGTSLTLAYRTYIIPVYVMVCIVTCWSYLAGRACGAVFTQRAATVALIGLLAFGIFAAKITREMWQQRTIFAGYARRY